MQRAPIEVLHGNVEKPVRLDAEVDDLHRIRVVEARGRSGFSLKASRKRCVLRVLSMQDFDSDRFIESDLACAKHGSHGARPQQLLDDELGGDRPADQPL